MSRGSHTIARLGTISGEHFRRCAAQRQIGEGEHADRSGEPHASVLRLRCRTCLLRPPVKRRLKAVGRKSDAVLTEPEAL